MSEEMKNLNEQPEETVVEHVEPKAEAPKLTFNLDKKTLAIIGGAAAAVIAIVAIVIAILLGGGTTPPPAEPVLNDYTLGMGVAFGEFKVGEFNATVATVVLDKDGKIVACRIDAVQNKFAADFENETFNFTRLETKMELGTNYGMSTNPWSADNNGDGIIKEWDEQAKAFEKHVIGMTAAQVEAMVTKTLENGYVISDDNVLLSAGCTIQITEFKAAVVKACNDEFKVSFKSEGNFTLGLAATSKDNGSVVTFDDATIKMNVDFAASVVEGGKIVASLNDAAQPQIAYDYEGTVSEKSVGKGADILKTKRELKEDYAMGGKPWSPDNDGDGRVLEWYLQSAEFSKYVVGKTGAQVADLETEVKNDHNISTDSTLISAGCTIDISGLKTIVAKSVTNAR